MKKEQLKKLHKTDEEIAISVKGVSKTFRIPHEKVNSLRGAAVSIFKDNSYEEFKALDDVSFEVKKGEFFGIIGRNGSGKSTLLKVLAGIYKPDKGKVKIKGMISPFLELGIGFNPELSGKDNVYLNATVLGMTKKQIDEKFDSIVKFSELERFIDQKLKNYSSGMQVRLAFSVSIHANRDILLMDEVLAVGDANFQKKCLDYFQKIKQSGKTIILVSHSQSSIEDYCDRVVMLKDGSVVMEGSPKKVFEHYNTDLNNVIAKTAEHSQQDDIINNRWGNLDVIIESIQFNDDEKVFSPQKKISGTIILKIQKKDIRNILQNINLNLSMYDAKNALIFLDKKRLQAISSDIIHQPFEIDIPNLSTGNYSFSIRVDHKDSVENGVVYDHWDKDNSIYFKNNSSKNSGLLVVPNIFCNKIGIIGMIRMRNEELILQDTLDSLAHIVDGIVVYDDASTDDSVDIARRHPAVLDIIENKIWKKNRVSEETENRQMLLECARKYNPQWMFYADCDERFDGNIREFLLSEKSNGVDAIKIRLFDAYITQNDQNAYISGKLYDFRKYFGPERRDIVMVWRNKPGVSFQGLDQREPRVQGNIIDRFYCQHYGKAISIDQWENTCKYYMKYFPEPYKTKWSERQGMAIHSRSDFGAQLYTWDDVKKNGVKIN